jgi:hypothetical protein
MPELLAVMLICAATIPHASCDRTTATDVMVSRALSPFDCLMKGQATIAGTAFDMAIGQGRYLKVVCERPRRAAVANASARQVPSD